VDSNQEDPVTLRETIGCIFDPGRRTAERARYAERGRAHAEADRRAALADQIDLRAGRQPGYQHELTVERAAAPERPLQGAELDAELDRLTEAFPETEGPEPATWMPYPEDVTDPPWGRQPEGQAGREPVWKSHASTPTEQRPTQDQRTGYYRSPGGSDEHRAAYETMRERDAGIGYGCYEIDNAEELARERYDEVRAEEHYRQTEAGHQEEVTASGAAAERAAWRRGEWERTYGPYVPGPDPAPTPDYYRESHGRYKPDWIPEPDGVSPAAHERYLESQPGSDEHKAAYVAMHREVAGRGFPGPDPDQSYLADHGFETGANQWLTREAEGGFEPDDAWHAAGEEPGEDAANWGPELDEPDHPYGAPECDEPDPETAHFGRNSPEAQDRGTWAIPRVLEPGQVSKVHAPGAAMLPDGTPHLDPQQAARGWQAQGGLYRRGPQMQAEAV
jgi:hypothetical protein